MKKSRKVVGWTLAMAGCLMMFCASGEHGFAMAFGSLILIVAGAAIGKAFFWQGGDQ